MAQITVGISDMKFSTRAEDVIVTHSLGSCLGVTAYDKVLRIGAMVHCLLPLASASPDKAQANPHMFVSSSVPAMVKLLFKLGATKNNLIFKCAGGANMRGDTMFNTGSRNFEALDNLLKKNAIVLAGQEVGGSIPRTMSLHLDTGRVMVRTYGEEHEI
jgi:chemotaxis protein CheD